MDKDDDYGEVYHLLLNWNHTTHVLVPDKHKRIDRFALIHSLLKIQAQPLSRRLNLICAIAPIEVILRLFTHTGISECLQLLPDANTVFLLLIKVSVFCRSVPLSFRTRHTVNLYKILLLVQE